MLSLTTFIQVGATQFHLLATFSIISLCNTLTHYPDFYEGLHKTTQSYSNLKYLYDSTYIPHFQFHSILQYSLENKKESKSKTDQMNGGKSKRKNKKQLGTSSP